MPNQTSRDATGGNPHIYHTHKHIHRYTNTHRTCIVDTDIGVAPVVLASLSLTMRHVLPHAAAPAPVTAAIGVFIVRTLQHITFDSCVQHRLLFKWFPVW